MSGAIIAGRSAAIWNIDITRPAWCSGPTMSATAACWAGLKIPVPKPESRDSTTSNARLGERPMAAEHTEARLSPMMMGRRRPTRSDQRPLKVSAAALPAAKHVMTSPTARGSRPSTWAAKSGTIATRTPNDIQPLPKLESNAARYFGLARASARLYGGRLWRSRGCPWRPRELTRK